MQEKLSLKGKLAMLIVFPAYIVLALSIGAIVLLWWTIAMIMKLTGIIDAFIFLLRATMVVLKKKEFVDNLDPLDRAAMKMPNKKK